MSPSYIHVELEGDEGVDIILFGNKCYKHTQNMS